MNTLRGTRKLWVALMFLCAAAVPAWAQAPPLPLGSPVPAPTAPEGPRRGPITVTPTISVTGEWNDNVFQNNANKVSDFILGITPGISVAIESPIYRLIGSYSFTSEFYADQDQLNEAFAQHNLRLDASYRVTPLLTLFLSDAFTVANNSNLVAVENVSTGRTQSTSNTLSPGLAYQLSPRDTLRLRGTWTTQSYDTPGALGSDTYALEGFWDHAYTSRLTVSGGYQFAYFDVEGQPGVHTHTPRVGVSYRITETLTGSLSGGPTLQVPE
ncbi:MAG TPA: outer membrane beta-barrel protein, partial [Terriglobales bacterium]|nr:outer membrane beta-barrel protein [Terriglobales bacterium]